MLARRASRCITSIEGGIKRRRHLHEGPRTQVPLISIPPHAEAYPLGSTTRSTTPPILTFGKDGLEVPSHGGFGLAIVGDGDGRRRLVETLLSKHKFHPMIASPGPFPYAATVRQREVAQPIETIRANIEASSSDLPPTPSTSPAPFIRHLTFSRPSATGEFTDYTARYGSLQESDRFTLTDYFSSSLFPPPTPERIRNVAARLKISHLLDLPLVALSSGQTRRARIGAGLLARPRVLLLEDPFAGLDPGSRLEIGDVLGKVNGGSHEAETDDDLMRLILILRGEGAVGLPAWITHISTVMEGTVSLMRKEEYLDRVRDRERTVHQSATTNSKTTPSTAAHVRDPLIELTNVGVQYGPKEILKSVSWTVRPGDRWHLQGSNGSGKTTLLSILLGHHPRSYSLPATSLKLFGQPRRETVTSILKQKMGHASPEIFAAFPRNMGLSAGEAIGSGFEGVFARRRLDSVQKTRVLDLITRFKDLLSGRTSSAKSPEDIFELDFAHYPPAQQALLMFLRAVVARPPVLVLDEASQAMDEASWARCRSFLEAEWEAMKSEGFDQAVICVSHYEEEVPWEAGQGQILRLLDGAVIAQ